MPQPHDPKFVMPIMLVMVNHLRTKKLRANPWLPHQRCRGGQTNRIDCKLNALEWDQEPGSK